MVASNFPSKWWIAADHLKNPFGQGYDDNNNICNFSITNNNMSISLQSKDKNEWITLIISHSQVGSNKITKHTITEHDNIKLCPVYIIIDGRDGRIAYSYTITWEPCI